MSFRKEFDKLLFTDFKDKVDVGLGHHLSDQTQMALIRGNGASPDECFWNITPVILKMADTC